MTVEHGIGLVAGSFILISLVLAHFVSPWWLLFTAFIGLNLLQSAVTNWCPMMAALRALGLRGAGQGPRTGDRSCGISG